ncbi:hypothetical protein LINPERHAP2_LOCUS34833 [Linum perenne]
MGKCGTCGGKSAIECPGCKGSGKNNKNGNMFERWKVWNEKLSKLWRWSSAHTRVKGRKMKSKAVDL